MKAYLEKDNAGRPIWRVKYFVAKRRIRKTFHSLEDANAWIDSNKEIATEKRRIFWEAWYGINSKERHDLLDALSLIWAHWAKHPQSKLTMMGAARNQITLVDSIETSVTLQEAID